jgi:CSLREA domain-containing protein
MRKLRRTLALIVALLALALPLGSASGTGGTFIVNSTADPGENGCDEEECTLREALLAAAGTAGIDTVAFDIPDTDSNYGLHTAGVWTIPITSTLYVVSGFSEVIDGTTQAANYGSDTNPYGPEIEISGENLGSGFACWSLGTESYNTIKGLVINRCPSYGLMIQGNNNLVIGNYVGTDATGSSDPGTGTGGIAIGSGATYNTIGGASPGEGNLISGNVNGIRIYGTTTHDNVIVGNLIGTDRTGRSALGNSASGVEINGGAHDNTVGPGNVIAYNTQRGVYVHEEDSIRNTITQNSIHSNGGWGIQVTADTGETLQAPIIDPKEMSCFNGVGTADPSTTIEIFSDLGSQGRIYLGWVDSGSGEGEFEFAPDMGFFPLPYVTLTATDHNGNTSQFSTAVATGCIKVYAPLATKNY